MSGERQSAEVVRAQAAAWLLRRRDCDTWSTEDQCALDVWLEASLANRIAYLRLEAVWRDADRLTVLRKGSERRMIATLQDFVPALGRVTALLAIVAGLAAGTFIYLSRSPDKAYATSIGERKIVKLVDGSRIELNTDTALRVSIDAAGRHVALERGEAFFQISHDAAHPFTVEAGGYRVVDLGTKFAIRRDESRLNLDLVEGRARLESSSGKHQPIVLTPGDTVSVTPNSFSVRRKSPSLMADSLAWRRGILVFHRTPLAEVVAQYNRYNAQKIGIIDPSVAQRTITATLPTNDIAAFARIATDFFDLHVTRRGGDIVISR
jgi:transmembrane sensor